METLVLVGDVMLGRLVNDALRRVPPTYPWGDVLPLFRAADWRCCNLECVVSDVVPARLPYKVFHFRSDARNVAVLTDAGIEMVSNANNHSLDFGAAAMLDMLRRLDRAGIAHAGAGADLYEARQPALGTTRSGTSVAMLSCTDNEPGWAAGDQGRVARVRLRPTVIAGFQARLASGPEAQAIIARMGELCADLGTSVEVREGELLVPVGGRLDGPVDSTMKRPPGNSIADARHHGP